MVIRITSIRKIVGKKCWLLLCAKYKHTACVTLLDVGETKLWHIQLPLFYQLMYELLQTHSHDFLGVKQLAFGTHPTQMGTKDRKKRIL